jgi:hypothetical protein
VVLAEFSLNLVTQDGPFPSRLACYPLLGPRIIGNQRHGCSSSPWLGRVIFDWHVPLPWGRALGRGLVLQQVLQAFGIVLFLLEHAQGLGLPLGSRSPRGPRPLGLSPTSSYRLCSWSDGSFDSCFHTKFQHRYRFAIFDEFVKLTRISFGDQFHEFIELFSASSSPLLIAPSNGNAGKSTRST